MAPAGYGSRVEGVHAVAAAARAGRITELWVETRRRNRPGVAPIIESLQPGLIKEVKDVRTMAETEAPQGLVADCRPIAPVTLERLSVDRAAVLVLDHIEDPHNVGAIARTALATGIDSLVISARRSAPLSAAAFKAAAGALETLPVAVVNSIPEALRRLKDGGLWVVGLDTGGDQSLFGLDLFTEPVAVVVGAEGEGIATLTAKRCDVIVSIPMAEGTESLNASVSAALASFEIMRVRSNL